jgi:hypothetical protein
MAVGSVSDRPIQPKELSIMSVPHPQVNPQVEPVLFPGGALSITVEALLDPEDHTVLFVVRAFDVPAGKLIALASSSPRSFDDYQRSLRESLHHFQTLVDEHTGPF